MSTTQITGHSFYHGEVGKSEKKILTELTDLCGFGTDIGVIDYYHDVPTVEIGVLDYDRMKPNEMPVFKKNQKITISPITVDGTIQYLPEDSYDIPVDFLLKVVTPLMNNWIEVLMILHNNFLPEQKDIRYKQMMAEQITYWKNQKQWEKIPASSP